MATAFVTGANGFLGLNLVEQLLAAGWSVTAMHRASSDITYLEPLGSARVVAELDDVDSMTSAIPDRVDAVFHVAGDVSYWHRHNERQTKTNVDGTRNVITAALRAGATRYVQTSSIAAYGLHRGVISETTPSTAIDSGVNYSRTKWLADEEVRRGIERGLDAVIVQPVAIFGKYDRSNWSRVIRMVVTGTLPGVADVKMDFCAVAAVARAHIAAAERGKTGEQYLLAGTHATMLELVELIADVAGGKAPRRPTPNWVLRLIAQAGDWSSRVTGRPPSLTPELFQSITAGTVVDNSKAIRELGFEVVPLREMVEETVTWLRSEGLI